MYKIKLEKKCGCAKKDARTDEVLSKTFSSKEEAELEVLKFVNHANASWCKKHRFYATEEGNDMVINMELSCPNEIK